MSATHQKGLQLQWSIPLPVTTGRPIRVFIVDDHELVRRGLTDLLTATDDLIIVGEAATVADALHRIPAAAPDVALLDARLPDGSGIEVCREIRSSHQNIRCLILTSYDDDEALFAAVMAGASGYLLKQIGGNSLVDGIRQVAAGRSLLDPAVTEKLLDRLRNPIETDPLAGSLTVREREILDLIADGCTNRQIGERLFLAERPSRTTSPAYSPSSACNGVRRPRCTEQPCAGGRAGVSWRRVSVVCGWER